MALLVSGAARGSGPALHARHASHGERDTVVGGLVTGGLAGAVSGGILASASGLTSSAAHAWRPAVAAGVGVGPVFGLAVAMIEANRYGHDEPARPTSDGLSFREQHRRDASRGFVAELPSVRF